MYQFVRLNDVKGRPRLLTGVLVVACCWLRVTQKTNYPSMTPVNFFPSFNNLPGSPKHHNSHLQPPK